MAVDKSRKDNNNANKDETHIVEKNKGKYFEWRCSICGWGSRGYDKDAIISIKT